jgi:DNA-binding response OmpR family regulator
MRIRRRKDVNNMGKFLILSVADHEEHILNKIIETIANEPELDHIALPPSNASLSFPNLEIRLKEQTVSCNGQLVTLTYHEFAVLAYLARHPGWVFSAYQIYEAIWCKDGENCGTAVASVIGQIRRKLTPDTPKGGYIRTILGSGYKFSSSPF